MAPFKETESSQLCASEIPICRSVRRLTSFEKAMNMKNLLSLLVELLPTCSSSVIENLSKCSVSWDRTKIQGIRQSGSLFPIWKHISHIESRFLQVVRKHKSRRKWFAHALMKKERGRNIRTALIFNNTPNHETSPQVTLTQESNIMVQPSKVFEKQTFQTTTIIPYALKPFSEGSKPPIKITIQFTRTSSCGEPFLPSLDYMNIESSERALEPKIIETKSESSIASKRFKSLETSSSSESVSSSESYKSSISSVVMVTLPKALSETLKCASAFSNSGNLSLENFVSNSAPSHFKILKDVKRSSFSENSMHSSISYDSLTHSGSSESSSSEGETEKGFSKLNTNYLKKLPRCRKKLKVDVCSAKKCSCKKRCKMRWLTAHKLLIASRGQLNEKQFTAQDVKYLPDNEPKIFARKRPSCFETAFSTSLQEPAKRPHITRSVRSITESDETDHECIMDQDMSPPNVEPMNLEKPLRTTESGLTSSSDPVTPPDAWSPCLTPVESHLTSPAGCTRPTSRISKFPSVTRRKRRAHKEKGKKILNSNFGPKPQRSRRRYSRSHGRNVFLSKELFLLPPNESLLHFVHSVTPEKKGLSPVRGVCFTKRGPPKINDPLPEWISKGGISSCKRPHSSNVNKSQQKPISGRKRSRSGALRSLSATRRSTSPTKTYMSASERPRLKIKRPRLQATPATKLSQYLSDQLDTEVIASPTTARSSYSSTPQSRAPGQIFPNEIVGSSLKFEQMDFKGEKHPLTDSNSLLTPLTSSPLCITSSPSCTTKPSSPASWFTPTKYPQESTAPSNVKSFSAPSTREGPQILTLPKRPSSQGTRSSSPTTAVRLRNVRRQNLNSPTRLGAYSPTGITRKPTAELKNQFSFTSNPKRTLKRKSQMSEKTNPELKRKKSLKRNALTPTKPTWTPSKSTTTGGEKSSISHHLTWSSFHTVDPPAKIGRIPSQVVQRSRPRCKSAKTLLASSPSARIPSLSGRATSPTEQPQTPSGPPPSPVGRPSSPIGRPVTQISRTTFPISQSASRIWRTASPIGRKQSRIDRTISPIGRTHSPSGLNFLGIARTPSRTTWASTRPTRKSGRNSRGSSPTECTSFQLPSTPIRKRRTQSRRVQEPAQKIRTPLQNTRKSSTLTGLSGPSSFVSRTPPLSALASSFSSSPFQSSAPFSRCLNPSVQSSSSTSRSSKTTNQSVSSVSRSANKSSGLPRTPTDRVSRLNQSVLLPLLNYCTPVKSSRTRSVRARSFSRKTCVTPQCTRTPSRITRNLKGSNSKPRKISRKSTRATPIPSTIFFSPRVYFKSPSRSIRIPAKFPRSPSKNTRTPRRTRNSPSSPRNATSQVSRAASRSPSSPVTCSTATTQTAPTRTPSPPSNSTPQVVEVCDKGTSSCPFHSLPDTMANESKASRSWIRLGNTYLSVTSHKDSSHRRTEVQKKVGRKKNRSAHEISQ